MASSPFRRLAALAATLVIALSFPLAASATITGGCTGTGTATSGGVDLTTATEWHVKRVDIGGGSGEGPTAHNASVAAYALGIPIPIASGTSVPGESSGSVTDVPVATLSLLGKRFVVSGSADNNCAGQILIIIDDVDPLFTLLGGGGAILGVVGGLLVLRTMRGGKGILKRILDAIYGAVGGLGAALALEQFGILDPTTMVGLIVVILAAVFGFLTCGLLGGGKKPPAPTPAPAPAPPPPPAQPMSPDDGPGDAVSGQVLGGQSSPGGAEAATEGPAISEPTGKEVYPPGAEGGGGAI